MPASYRLKNLLQPCVNGVPDSVCVPTWMYTCCSRVSEPGRVCRVRRTSAGLGRGKPDPDCSALVWTASLAAWCDYSFSLTTETLSEEKTHNAVIITVTFCTYTTFHLSLPHVIIKSVHSCTCFSNKPGATAELHVMPEVHSAVPSSKTHKKKMWSAERHSFFSSHILWVTSLYRAIQMSFIFFIITMIYFFFLKSCFHFWDNCCIITLECSSSLQWNCVLNIGSTQCYTRDIRPDF